MAYKNNSREINDAQFEAFLKASVSSEESTIDTARINQFLDGSLHNQNGKPLWMVEEKDEDCGLTATGKNFLKAKSGRISTVAATNMSENSKKQGSKTLGNDMGLSKDSLDEDIDVGQGKKLNVGLDTLDEIKDKENFFKELKKQSDSTLDFSQMNKDLDGSATLGTTLDQNQEQPFIMLGKGEEEDIDEGSSNEFNESAEQKREDMEDDNDYGVTNSGDQKVGLLSKVALLDSLDSTLGTKRGSQDPEVRSQDMKTIPECTEGPEEKKDDVVDGYTPVETSEYGHASQGIEKGLNGKKELLLKTGTGFGFTDTSLEMEKALQKALIEAGTSTFDDSTRDFMNTNLAAVDTSKTTAGQQTVDDIIREVEEMPNISGSGVHSLCEHQEKLSGTGSDTNLSDHSEQRGFILTPVHSNDGIHIRKNLGPVPSQKILENLNLYPSLDSRPGDMQNGTEPVHQSSKPGSGSVKKKAQKYDIKGAVSDPHLMASVQSFASYIQTHFADDSTHHSMKQWSEDVPVHSSLGLTEREKALINDVKDWQERWQEERKLHAKLQLEYDTYVRDNQKRLENLQTEHEHDMRKLKQENFVLTAKVSENESSVKQKLRDIAEAGGANAEHVVLLEKEVREQEVLLAGYQAENERLYQEMKKMQKQSKAAEERLFRENQKLNKDLVKLRDELEQKDIQLRNKSFITGLDSQQQVAAMNISTAVLGAGKIKMLEAELKQAKIKEWHQEQDIEILKKTKEKLEQQAEEMVKKIEDCEERLNNAKKVQNKEAKEIHLQLENEIAKLKGKLKWYAENQQFLDKDVHILRMKDEEIKSLNFQIEKLSSQVGCRNPTAFPRTKERSGDSKKIQDLERQVKEMENIIRKRHPNSLPVLMWAASTAPDLNKKTPSVEFLEKHIKKLESELEKKDEEGKICLRALEQKYHAMKFQYEERIKDLESQVSKLQIASGGSNGEESHPHTHVKALQRELEAVKDRYKNRIAELEAEADVLKKDIVHLKTTSAGCGQKNDKAFKGKMKAAKKADGILQPESEYVTISLPGSMEPSTYKDRAYQADFFSGHHISDVLRENDELKLKLDRLQLEQDQQRVYIQKIVAENEAKERHIREEADERVSALRSSHQSELEKLLSDQALYHSVSTVTELQSKLDTQDVVIRHLKEQLLQGEVLREQLSAARIRESALENQVEKLLDDLHEAKKSYTPQMRHFEALQDKIKQLEIKHEQREQELKTVLHNSQSMAKAEIQTETEKWRQIVDSKNREIETFRTELDSILEVLKQLHKQGVILPHSEKNLSLR